MKKIAQVERIKRFKLTCTLNDNGVERHFHCGHEYVEIGGIKWATCNVGAEKVTDYGKYFTWGEVKGYTADEVRNSRKYFCWEDYRFRDGQMTKYNETDVKVVLEPIDDAVASAWGGQWRMPTAADFQALGSAVNTQWTNDYQGSGIAGLVCTDKTDSSKVLFFPACGYCSNNSVYNVGSGSYYWSSSLHSSNVYLAYYNSSFYGDYVGQHFSYRFLGFSVRGVIG